MFYGVADMADPKHKQRSDNQGEGDKEAARRFNKETRQFLETEKAKKRLREGAELSEEEKAEGAEAEKRGRQRAKEADPEVVRDYDEPTRPRDEDR
jgi:hypothetical protein